MRAVGNYGNDLTVGAYYLLESHVSYRQKGWLYQPKCLFVLAKKARLPCRAVFFRLAARPFLLASVYIWNLF
jgi:hypothetical protein